MLGKKPISSGVLGACVLGASCVVGAASAYAQGTVAYEPAPSAPAMSTVGLVIVAVLLALAGYRAVRNPAGTRRLTLLVLFAAVGILLSARTSYLVRGVSAVGAGAAFDNPLGGQINLGWGFESHENTSGIPIRITDVAYDGHNAQPVNECVAGMILTANGSCNTQVEAVCGNGIVEDTEQCDDSGQSDFDGCSSVCTLEDGYKCSGSPSVCTLMPSTCSDHVKNTFETDVDCGGQECRPCASGKHCNLGSDCASGTCTSHVCQ